MSSFAAITLNMLSRVSLCSVGPPAYDILPQKHAKSASKLYFSRGFGILQPKTSSTDMTRSLLSPAIGVCPLASITRTVGITSGGVIEP